MSNKASKESAQLREDILAIIRATGLPLTADEIANAMLLWKDQALTTMCIASHLGYMRAKGLVAKKQIALGQPKQYGRYAFPSGGTKTVWFTTGMKTTLPMRQIREDAQRHKRLPRAVIPICHVPHTDDMVQMLSDIQTAMASSVGVLFNQMGNQE